MKKTFKVVMLPTEKASKIQLGTSKEGKLVYTIDEMKIDPPYIQAQHLYIISDEEVKKGDYAITSLDGGKTKSIIKCEENGGVQNGYCKIIASTDKSLHHKSSKGLKHVLDEFDVPSIPESFIKAYIKAYNENKPITEVDLEMEPNEDSMRDYPPFSGPYPKDCIKFEPKTRPDGSVIVHQSKMYSRTEVITLFTKYIQSNCGLHKFLEENL